MIKTIKPDYHNSILNVSASLLQYYGADTIYDDIPELRQVLEQGFKHVFLLLLDGMGMNIINQFLKKDDFLRRHVVKPITSVFPSTTVAATNAVLTVKPPWSSGYLGWVQYLKEEDVYDTVFLNKDYYDSEKVITVDLLEKYFNQPKIYDYIKEVKPHVITRELFPNFRIDGFDSLEDQLKEMIHIAHGEEETFTYIYWGEPDLTEHDYGPKGKGTKVLLKATNQIVDQYAKKLPEDSLLIVIADHGHQQVKPIYLYEDYDLMSMLDKKPSMEARATSFFVKPDLKETFEVYFNQTYRKYFKLYKREDVFKEALLGFGKKHALIDQCVGDYLAVATGNRYFQFIEKKPFKGHHAGLTENEMLVPLIIFTNKK